MTKVIIIACAVFLLTTLVFQTQCEEEIIPRIFGGDDISSADYFAYYRYMAEIYISGDKACMGALIAPRLVLTLAYCVTSTEAQSDGSPKPVNSLDIVFHLLKSRTASPEEIRVDGMNESNIIRNPNYNFKDPETGNDIAIIVMPYAVSNITPMVLVSDKDVVNSSSCYTTGWFITNLSNDYPEILQEITLKLACTEADMDMCVAAWAAKSDPFLVNTDLDICAGYYGGTNDNYIGPCNGERGTILQCLTDKGNRIGVGILIEGSDCINDLNENKIPAVFENLLELRSFIDPIVANYTMP